MSHNVPCYLHTCSHTIEFPPLLLEKVLNVFYRVYSKIFLLKKDEKELEERTKEKEVVLFSF